VVSYVPKNAFPPDKSVTDGIERNLRLIYIDGNNIAVRFNTIEINFFSKSMEVCLQHIIAILSGEI